MLEQRFVPPRLVVPGPPPRGLALLRTLRTNVLQMWPEEAYQADSLRLRFLNRTMVLLNQPAAIHRVLLENEGNYRRSRLRLRLLRPVVGNGLLLSEGPAWKHQRRTAAPAFAPRGIPILARHIAAAAAEGSAALAAGELGRVDLFATMQRWAAEISGRSMFSLEMGKHGAAMRRLSASYVHGLARPFLLDALMPAGIPSPRDLARAVFSRRWMRLIEAMIGSRLGAPDAEAPRDLLDLLRDARHGESGAGFSPVELRDQVATMIVAGHETTSVAMFWSLYLLASVPAAQQAVAAEVAGLDLGPEAAAASLPRLVQTRAVVSEALRLYPPAFMIVREAIAADRCGETEVPAGATVLVAPWVLQRHRALWDDPDAFDPRRFLPGAPAPGRFAYLPFGVGPRVCIGAQFAIAMAVLVVGRLIQDFAISVDDAEPVTPVCVVTTRPNRAPAFRLRPRGGPLTPT